METMTKCSKNLLILLNVALLSCPAKLNAYVPPSKYTISHLLTWVGARDTCVSKNLGKGSLKKGKVWAFAIPTLDRVSF